MPVRRGIPSCRSALATLGLEGARQGNAFREFLLWYEQDRGQGALLAAFDRLEPALRSELDRDRPALGVLPSVWYPAAVVHPLLDAVTEGAPPAELDRLVREGARHTIDQMMRGVQRIAFSLLVSPARYPRIINTLWRLNYDSGQVRVLVHGPRKHESIVTGWQAHHRLACRLGHASKERMYQVMGCRSVHVRQTACIADGAADCRSVVTWT